MSEQRVHVVGPYGERGTVLPQDVNNVIKAGGRVATSKEIAETRANESYERASTGQKVLGHASTLVGPIASNALAGTGAAALRPEVEAFQSGEASAATLGLDKIATKYALESVAGKGAGKAYAEHLRDTEEANPGWHTAGELTGFAAMAAGGSGAGLARAVPGLGVSALGGAAEAGAARALAGVAARGALGRALATGGELAARGMVEGALYGAANQVTEDVLGDHEVAADRVFAAAGMGALYGGVGGAVLGSSGSLAKSAVGGVGRGIARLSRPAEDAIAKTEAAAAKAEAATAKLEGVATKADEALEESGVQKLAKNFTTDEGRKALAYDQAWKAVGAGYGLQTTRYAKQAAKYFPNGTRDLGEVAIRHGIIDVGNEVSPVAAAWKAGVNGTPAEMLPKIQAASDLVGTKIGDLTQASGATVKAQKLAEIINDVAKPYEGKAGQRHIGTTVREYGAELGDVLQLKGPSDVVTVQDLLIQRKALDEIVYRETKQLDPKMRVQALRDVRAKMEDLITGAIDEASGKAKGELAAEYKTLKKDFHALRILEEAAEDSAARSSKAATLSLTDKMMLAGGLASGNLLSGPALGFGSKLVRERGNAAAAVLLYRMGEIGSVQRAIQLVDQQLGRSAKGLLQPAKGTSRSAAANPVQSARKAEERLAELSSKPERVVERAATVTQGLTTAAPTVGGGVARNLTRAMAFLNAKLPPVRTSDPLSPDQKRAWTQTEAAKFMRYVEAAEDPMGVLEDVERGKVTREGVETLRVLAPTLYRDLQIQTMDAIAEQLAKGKPIPFETRLKIGVLLDVPADPSLVPRTRAFLQGNVVPLPPPNGTSGGGPKGASSKPLKLPTQHTAFDKLTDMKR